MKVSHQDIDAIVTRCKEGEEAAFSELFRIIRTDIHRILIGVIGPDPEIDDMIQTASLEVFRSIHSFKGKAKFSTWMYRLVVNVALQELRRKKNREIPVDVGEMANELRSETANPERTAFEREHIRLVHKILDDIAPKKRIVFLLHEIEGYTPEEIAGMVGSSRYTVKSRLFYARREFYRKSRRQAMLLASREKNGCDGK